MSDYKPLTCQNDLKGFTDSLDLEDAFVKEAYVVSPSFLVAGSDVIGCAEIEPTAKILICMPYPDFCLLEIVLEKVEEFLVSFNEDLDLSVQYHSDLITISLNESGTSRIRAKSAKYRFLESLIYRDEVYFGKEPVFDEYGFLKDDD